MHRFNRIRVPALLIAAGWWSALPAQAQETHPDSAAAHQQPTRIPEVTVFGTHSDMAEMQEAIASVPGGAALIAAERIRATRQANLHDVLRLTPGVYVQRLAQIPPDGVFGVNRRNLPRRVPGLH